MSCILYEYNREETLAYIAEEQYALGYREGLIEGYIEVRRESNISEDALVVGLMKKFDLSEEKAIEYMKKI